MVAQGRTALVHAACNGHILIVEKLLDQRLQIPKVSFPCFLLPKAGANVMKGVDVWHPLCQVPPTQQYVRAMKTCKGRMVAPFSSI